MVVTNAGNNKSVKDAAGKIFPLQKLSNGTSVFMVENVPALGTALYSLSPVEASPLIPAFVLTDSTLSNGKISIGWDRNNGSITSLQAGNNFNYAGEFKNQGLNSYWYVPGVNPADAVTNGNVQVTVIENGPVVTSIAITSTAPGANQLQRILSLYANGDEVEIANTIDKKSIRTNEGVNFGFPFNGLLNRTTLDAGYGSIKFLGDQLPGSNMDYLYGRRWIDASSSDKGIQLLLMEAPLVEPGNMIDERKTIMQAHKEWKKEGTPTATWFSYVMNNYWNTNYKADQEGKAMFRYALRPHNMLNGSEAEKAAASFTQPFIAIPVNDNTTIPGQLFELTNNRVVVTGITPSEEGGFIIRMFNPEQAIQETSLIWKSFLPTSIKQISTGNVIKPSAAITVAAMGISEFLVK